MFLDFVVIKCHSIHTLLSQMSYAASFVLFSVVYWLPNLHLRKSFDNLQVGFD